MELLKKKNNPIENLANDMKRWLMKDKIQLSSKKKKVKDGQHIWYQEKYTLEWDYFPPNAWQKKW